MFLIILISQLIFLFLVSYIYKMLPKLQQSSLAQSLRRDNPATLIQSNIWYLVLAEDQLKNIVNRVNN